jgi:hexosaminidase
MFPRILGLAETAWSKPEDKNWERFKSSAIQNIKSLKNHNVNVFYDSTLAR